jgi:hypothetical protein
LSHDIFAFIQPIESVFEFNKSDPACRLGLPGSVGTVVRAREIATGNFYAIKVFIIIPRSP